MIKTERINAYEASPGAMKAVMGVAKYLDQCGLEASLMELVKMRASQINGCAFCIDLHSKAAIKAGEDPQRLLMLDAWEESSLFSERERAALAWTEELTKISEKRAPDDLFYEVRAHFSDKEMSDLSTLIALINSWNRLAVGFRYQHG